MGTIIGKIIQETRFDASCTGRRTVSTVAQNSWVELTNKHDQAADKASVWHARKQAPFPDGSGFVEFKYDDVPLAPATDVPRGRKRHHECPEGSEGARSIRDFFLLNEIVQHCHGICESKTCPSGDSKN